MDAAAGNVINLTNSPDIFDGWPDWSPDGSKIAFTSVRDGNPDIYVMDADGSNVIRLTSTPEFDSWPDWRPVAE
jgi:Tol biopolymer transport system component